MTGYVPLGTLSVLPENQAVLQGFIQANNLIYGREGRAIGEDAGKLPFVKRLVQHSAHFMS